MRSMNLFFGMAALCALAACSGADGAPGVAGPAGAAGDKGPQGDPGGIEAALGIVHPRKGPLARDVSVVVTVNSMNAGTQATLDFGADIKVTDVQIVSATAIYAKLEIGDQAALGPRDVKVTAGGKTVTGVKAFEVVAPAKASVAEGKAEQGSMAVVDIVNQDSTAFDDFFDPGFPPFIPAQDNFALIATGAISLRRDSVTATDARYLVLFDPLATSVQFAGVNVVTTEPFPALPIAASARTPTALTAGTAATNQSIGAPMTTQLYKLTVPAQPAIVTLVASGVGTAMRPVLRGHDKSGKSLGGLLSSNTTATNGATVTLGFPVDATMNDGDTYLTVFDRGFGGDASNFGYTLTPTIIPIAQAGQVTEKTGNNELQADAQVIDPANLPVLIAADTSSDTDRDAYAINLTNGDRLEITFSSVTDAAGLRIGVAVPGASALTRAAGARVARGIFTAPSTGTFYVTVTGATTGTKKTGKYLVGLRKL